MSNHPESASRSLPERPDLRHLKDQAKDLLKENPDQDEIPKSLASAQYKLAREYGFASWPKLKSHVQSLNEAGRLRQTINSDDYETVKAMMIANPKLHFAELEYARCHPLTWVAECRGKPPTPERLALAQWMIENGSDVNQGNGMPLSRAALFDERIPMMELLVANGADVNLRPGIVLGACECLADTMLRWLFDHGAKSDISECVKLVITTYGRGSRHKCLAFFTELGFELPDTAPMAVMRGRFDLLEACLKRDPDMLAKRFDETEIFPAELGIEVEEARMTVASLHRSTLLHVAVELRLIEVAKWLVENGANVNATAAIDQEKFGGQTPLYHTTVSLGDHDDVLARLLLQHGADPNVRATFRHQNKYAGNGGLMREFIDVTPVGFARLYQNMDRALVNEAAIKAISEF